MKGDDNDNIKFWGKDPNVLLNKDHIFEFFPTENMTYEQKMNSITRFIIFLTIISFLFSYNYRLIVILIILLIIIYLLHEYHTKKEEKKMETFEDNLEEKPVIIENEKKDENNEIQYDVPTDTNPFSNVLITDYDYNPEKKKAPPAYNKETYDEIMTQAKQLVQNANPSDKNIVNKLFKGLGEEMEFEQSMRQFVSNPSTTIPNDQKTFAEFCYGSMVSAKEGNKFALTRNLERHQQ